MTKDVNVILLNLPTTTAEAVTENPDGSFTIIINARLSNERQLRAYEHAIKHIQNGDFEKSNVQSIEYAAHNNVVSENISKPIPAQEYLERVKQLQKERRHLKRQLSECEARMRFLNFDSDTEFEIVENQYLYGD